MLTKIELIVLKAILDESIDVSAMIELVEATDNPTVALEKLAGVYTPPKVEIESPKGYFASKERADIHFLSFNDFKGEVTFGYRKIETKTAWVLKGTTPNLNDVDPLFFRPSDTIRIELKMDRTDFEYIYEHKTLVGNVQEELYTATCSLSNWQ